ncbi:MAG: carbohydrate porin [Sandaracinaceae bacterium]
MGSAITWASPALAQDDEQAPWERELPVDDASPEPEPAPAGDEPTGEPWYRRGGGSAPVEEPAPTPAPEPAPPVARESDDGDDEDGDDEDGDDEDGDDEDGDDEDGDDEDGGDEDEHSGDFYFGSYGRIVGASDLNGREGRQNLLTAWGPRVDETETYAEIELRREDHFAGMTTQVVATVAYGGPLFHYDGEFSERIAIRNLFAEVRDLLTPGLGVWAGSRMWRGDDVYLFNMWPLDNLNLIGGGFTYALEDIGELRVAAGLAQPNDPFMRQEVLVPARSGFSPDSVVFLDRQRFVVGARLTWWPFGRFALDGIKTILYGESHYISAGDRQDEEGYTEHLPDDVGWVVGAQLGGYVTSMHAFANLFVRYGAGLGAYDPLGVPFRQDSVIQTGRAQEVRVALSANWEYDAFGLQVGAYYRYFRDADPNVFERGALNEGAIDLRPMVWFDRFVGVAADLSYSGMAASTINETTGQPEAGNLFKVALMPFVSPFGRGTYTRPHIRLIYSLSIRDDGARALYPVLDPRSASNVEHFFGIGVEWWFASSSYGS